MSAVSRMTAELFPRIPWRDRITIAKHEITCAAIIVADVLDRRHATAPDWARLTLALQRLRALEESK